MSAPVDLLQLLQQHAKGIGGGAEDPDGLSLSARACKNVASELQMIHDAFAGLVNAAQATRTSLQHMRGPEVSIHARTADLDAALARVKGGAA
ncbi:hypothetical protein [Stenotrophomonas pavanii]|uniref:hypothetical protein n=1 Tax=Stenotrophomonas pavanii TaxID=487698 RepID=UPI000885DFE6|nr:hypothetical protein [Stenotrophomonas pavanii]SDJ76969.1 hypothetical protein SAMN04487784_0014 [Stenotrophomonas pavanii]